MKQRKCQRCKEYKPTKENFELYASGCRATVCNQCKSDVKNKQITCLTCDEPQDRDQFKMMPSGKIYKKCKTCRAKRLARVLEKRKSNRKDESLIDRRILGPEAKNREHKTALQLKLENDQREKELLDAGKVKTVIRVDQYGIKSYVLERLKS